MRYPSQALSGVWLMLLAAFYAFVPAATVGLVLRVIGIVSGGVLAAPKNQSIRENLERYRKAAEAQPLF